MEGSIMLAQASTEGSSKAEAKRMYRLRKIIKKKSPLKKKRIGIIKVASGGTEIYKHWMKSNDGEDANFWQTMVDAITASKGSIKAFVWFQGENDSFAAWNKENYLENLTTFIGDVRREIHKSSSNFESPADVP